MSTASGAAPATQPAVAPIPGASTFLVVWNQWGFDGDGRILGRAVMTTKPKDDIFPIAEEPLAVRGAPTLAAAGDGTHLLAWEDRRGGNVDVYARLVRQEVVFNTSIAYTYDPLYRLTTAAYSGHVSASYSYTYDEAGNMTTYTEQVNGQTTSVSRTFNAANQLVSSSDEELGKSSFYYDQNGNLEMTLLPDDIRLGYRYNQRNLLEQAFRQAGPHGPEIMQAAFVYDGNANRVQQIDYSGGQPVTITYTNDILGMTQVLLADDGTTTTANLFGLDLISQNDGTQTRFLLTDGLGSVRQELAGGDLQTTTTYEPYGKLLTQTGTSGTTYGFTGEQEDAATGLVYLRARYYNPTLNQFQSRDPFAGYASLPQSQNGYSYVHGNPINYVDFSGLCAEIGDESCWSLAEQLWRTGQGSLHELGSMDYRDLELLRIYATCASNSVFSGTHPVVKARACGMINQLASQGYLVSSNPTDVVSQGYRTPADAHRFSTSYHLFYGFIDSEVLGCYPMDLDGNIWSDPARDFLYTYACSSSTILIRPANLCSPRARWAIENAQRGAGSNYACGTFNCGFSYAQEGYPPGDPRRLPNSNDVPVSNHVYGLAVDIVGWWSDDPDDIWGSPITNIARQFRLDRPFTEAYVNEQNAQLVRDNGRTRLQAEFWHFEPIDIERYR